MSAEPLCARCGGALRDWDEECEACAAELALPRSQEAPAASVEMTPESRRLHYFEIALVLSVGFLWPTIHSLYDWWVGTALSGSTELSSLHRILEAAVSISVLAYVLYWQGRSLRTIGLTTRKSEILWALAILFFDRLMTRAIYGNIHGIAAPKPYPAGDTGPLQWLAVIPGAAHEELIVRAFLMTEVAELTGSWALAVVASVGFQTLYHLYQGTPAALMAAGTFFVSAVFYASTRRITPVILAHSLHNFLFLAGW